MHILGIGDDGYPSLPLLQAVRQTLAENLMEVAGRLTHEQAEKAVIPLVLNFLINKEEAPEVGWMFFPPLTSHSLQTMQ